MIEIEYKTNYQNYVIEMIKIVFILVYRVFVENLSLPQRLVKNLL